MRIPSAAALATVIRVNVALLLGFAAVPLLAPARLLLGFGIIDPPFAVLGVVRVYAVLSIAFAAVLWGARFWLVSPAGRPTVRALMAVYAVGSLFLLLQQMAVWDGRSGLALGMGCGLLASSYARALFTQRPSDRVV